MAFSMNRIQLLGNIGQDAEHRFTTNNKEVTSFSLATTYSYKKNEEWVNETTWHNLVGFGFSDFQKGKLKKGNKIYIEGRLNKRDYENKEGVKVYVTEIIADKYSLIPLDSSESKPEEYNHFPKKESESDDDPDLPF